jgi:hypothetical protein
MTLATHFVFIAGTCSHRKGNIQLRVTGQNNAD